MNIHKAAFYWNEDKKCQSYTVCGNFNINTNDLKVSDWAEVTCKRCLKNKDVVSMSTVNLL